MTHYQALGVEPTATVEEIRRAYLSVARRHHPDRHAASHEAPAGSDDLMREANAAWAVLSDPERRARYDAELGLEPDVGPVVRRLDTTFVPYDEADDDEEWRFEPDVGDPRTAPGRISLLPLVLLAASVVVGLAWMVLDEERLLPVSVFLGVMSVVAFVVVPLVAMARAAHYEER